MSTLTPARLLELWEEGHGRSPTAKALSLLAVAEPAAAWEDLGALPLGERDRRLLAMREKTLGRRMEVMARCPACGEDLDLPLDVLELQSTLEGGGPSARELRRDGCELRFRPANSHDLLAAGRCPGVKEARRLLAERCVLEARRGDQPLAAEDLSEEEIEALAVAMAAADPGAELLLDLRCPTCGHAWLELLDVAALFWAELEAQTVRLLDEVHALASAYGWREEEILALSPQRRRAYLERTGA